MVIGEAPGGRVEIMTLAGPLVVDQSVLDYTNGFLGEPITGGKPS